MGKVKELAFWLASCVYKHGMSEREIVEIATILFVCEDGLDYSSWLRRQVRYIKQNPEVFGYGSNEKKPPY